MNKKELPIYELSVDDIETFVDAIALVENPAIEKGFIAFSETPKQSFAFNDEKMELLGAAIIPDLLIYRRTDEGFEYNVKFSAEEIRFIAQTFSKNSRQSNLNIEHTKVNADSYVFQSMIVDKAKGIAPLDLPDGTWVIGVKVNNPAIWNDIKDGKRKGFSIEGVFQLIESKFSKDEYLNEKLLMTRIQKIFSDWLNKNQETVAEMLAAKTDAEIKVSDMVVGGKVEVVGEDGSLQPAPDGEMDYNGHKLEIKDGLIVSIDGDKGEDKPAEEMADAPVEDAPVEDKPKDDMQAQIDELKSAIAEINKKLDAQNADTSKMEEMAAQFTKQIDQLNETIKAILHTPAEQFKAQSTNRLETLKNEKAAKVDNWMKLLASAKK
ncbi:MAG: XkdF-like putative serine protease domain-containing protein [Ferruginibacter sp.]